MNVLYRVEVEVNDQIWADFLFGLYIVCVEKTDFEELIKSLSNEIGSPL